MVTLGQQIPWELRSVQCALRSTWLWLSNCCWNWFWKDFEIFQDDPASSLIEFKDSLYSSPMTMPKDAAEGQVSSLPSRRNNLFVSPLTSYPWQQRWNRGSVSVLPPQQGETCRTQRGILSRHYSHCLPLRRASSSYITHPPTPVLY